MSLPTSNNQTPLAPAPLCGDLFFLFFFAVVVAAVYHDLNLIYFTLGSGEFGGMFTIF